MTLSELMLAELQYFKHRSVQLSETRLLHQTTLKSLLKRRLLIRHGNSLQISSLGVEVISKRELNMRKHEADVSDSVKAMLHVSKILPFRQRKAS